MLTAHDLSSGSEGLASEESDCRRFQRTRSCHRSPRLCTELHRVPRCNVLKVSIAAVVQKTDNVLPCYVVVQNQIRPAIEQQTDPCVTCLRELLSHGAWNAK